MYWHINHEGKPRYEITSRDGATPLQVVQQHLWNCAPLLAKQYAFQGQTLETGPDGEEVHRLEFIYTSSPWAPWPGQENVIFYLREYYPERSTLFSPCYKGSKRNEIKNYTGCEPRVW